MVYSDMKISAGIIAYNEELRLRACLESLKKGSVDEIVVVIDSRTTDGTARVAQEYGCRIFVEDWKGFGRQKQSALGKCANDWVLVLDSDETLPAGSLEVMRRELESKGDLRAAAFEVPRKNFLHGRWLRHGDSWPDWQTRLINRKYGRFVSDIHERWQTEGQVVRLHGAPIEHRGFAGYKSMLETMNAYSDIIARQLYEEGKSTNALAPLAHCLWMFTRVYLLKLGFLDGFDGLVTALLKAVGSFFKYAKLLEMRRLNN
jgi:glycosyltransferase involved in cell wall biosynthesis